MIQAPKEKERVEEGRESGRLWNGWFEFKERREESGVERGKLEGDWR